jgi:hypothetical protein
MVFSNLNGRFMLNAFRFQNRPIMDTRTAINDPCLINANSDFSRVAHPQSSETFLGGLRSVPRAPPSICEGGDFDSSPSCPPYGTLSNVNSPVTTLSST